MESLLFGQKLFCCMLKSEKKNFCRIQFSPETVMSDFLIGLTAARRSLCGIPGATGTIAYDAFCIVGGCMGSCIDDLLPETNNNIKLTNKEA